MTFHKGKKSRKVIRKRQLSDQQLIRQHIEEYKHQIAIGRDYAGALKYLCESTKGSGSLEKLRLRINNARGTPGTTGVSLDGIRVGKDTLAYIRRLEDEGIIEPYHKGQASLKLVGKAYFPWLK